MSSSDFQTVLIQDDRIANLTDKIHYAVNKGAQQVTSSEFAATSQSVNSIIFNVPVPSLETIIDRKVMIRSTITLKITGKAAVDKQLINYGNRDCLGPFPLHQIINTMTATINNNTISMNTKDLLPVIIRMLDPKELSAYNGTTPTKYDEYLNYSDMAGASNSSFSGFTQSSNDAYLRGRGAFPLDRVSASVADAPLVKSTDPAIGREAYVTFTVEEPLLLSPFIFGNPQSNNQGFYGIQNMSFNLTLGSANRAWRHYGVIADASVIDSVTIHEVKDSRLLFQFLSCHPSQQLSSRCVVPYYELSRYINSVASPIALTGPSFAGAKPTPGTAFYSSSTISFNQIPDKLIIFVRKSQQTCTDSDSFLPITHININWNNSSGVCSSFTQQDLWRKSVEAGSNQTWDEFRGYAYKQLAAGAAETTAGTGAGSYVPTCGSVLILNMGQHVNLIEDFYAPGSIGNFTFQIKVDCENWGPVYNTTTLALGGTAVTPELVVCTMNSGSFATEKGTSSTYTSLLTKTDVLEASNNDAIAHSDVKRLVGSGFLDSLKSVFKFATNPNNLKTAGQVLKTGLDVHDMYSGNKGNALGRSVQGFLGSGNSGGARSGGARSGGGLMARLK